MHRAYTTETYEEISRLIGRLNELGWYHSIELPDGQVIPGLQTLEQLRTRIARFPLPADLTGKRALDIGAWDGWFTFEMERRGASVLAVDSARQETFFEAKKLLNSKAEYLVEDVCYLTPQEVGYFDIVLFFGVLYHLKHPLLALERLCEVCTDILCMDTLVIDEPARPEDRPVLEFYETTELGGQYDNWCAPNTQCLLAFVRTAGFVNPRLITVAETRGVVVAYRKWPEIPRSGEVPEIICVENAWTRDHEFRSARDHYFSLWFNTPSDCDLNCDNVYIQVGPYACRPAGVSKIGRHENGGFGWHAVTKLAPGLSHGFFDVTVAVRESPFSKPVRIPIDLTREERRQSTAPIMSGLEIAGITDGKTYEYNRIRTGTQSCVSVWARNFPAEATRKEIALRLDGADLPAVFFGEPDENGYRQVNAMLPAWMTPGEYQLTVNCRGAESAPSKVELYKAL
jgi:tRNA (mo5U34)-methyltransferase